MGFLDFLVAAAEVVDLFSGNGGSKYSVKCECLELFEIGTTWKGTARIHGAGKHLETIKMNDSTTLVLPNKDDDSRYTPRGLLRKDLREWVGKMYALCGSISKEMVVLNDGENCLTIEGFVKKIDGNWKLVNTSSDATHFGAYKLNVVDNENKPVGHEDLKYLFKADTLGRVVSVDVTDGF